MKRWSTSLTLATLLFGAGIYPLWGRSAAEPVEETALQAEPFDPFTTAAAARHRSCQSTSWRAMLLND